MNYDGRKYQLRIDLIKNGGQKGYALYKGFRIGPGAKNYKLFLDRFIRGNAGE